MNKQKKRKPLPLERVTDWIGSMQSVVVHVLLIGGIFLLQLFGVSFNRVLLILTTFLSIEAIFLAIFIQMSVNRTTDTIEEISEDDKNDDEIDKELTATLRRIEKRMSKQQEDLEILKKKGLM